MFETHAHSLCYYRQHQTSVCLLQIMASMIEEADDVSQQLLDTILECVTSPKKEEQPEAHR